MMIGFSNKLKDENGKTIFEVEGRMELMYLTEMLLKLSRRIATEVRDFRKED